MNILMTNHRLSHRGGSELFTSEIAETFRDLGHAVCVFTTLGGEVAEHLTGLGNPVVAKPGDCPFRPDIIHGQHHLETMAAIAAWPGVPAVYFIHGATPWEEHPPVHPRLRHYLATSPRFAWWVARECGVEETSLLTVHNFFDPRRFRRTREPRLPMVKALVFHNTMAADGAAHRELQAACAEAGMTLDAIGQAFGKTIGTPEDILPDYDVVFAAGRSAIEAMACGCAVIPITSTQSAEWIHPGNFNAMRDRNFTAELNSPPLDRAGILNELRAINPTATMEVSRRIRSEATLAATAGRLLECYGLALAQPSANDPEYESRAMGNYLTTIAARVKDADDRRSRLVEEKSRAVQRAESWKAKAEDHRQHLSWLEQECSAGPWWQRRWWRELRRKWEEKKGR